MLVLGKIVLKSCIFHNNKIIRINDVNTNYILV